MTVVKGARTRRLVSRAGRLLVVCLALALPGTAVASTVWDPVSRVNDDSTVTSQVGPDVALGPSGSAIARARCPHATATWLSLASMCSCDIVL